MSELPDPEYRISVDYSYLRLHSWYERRGDTLVYMSRADKYDTFTNELRERGKVHEGGRLLLNGWEPPAGSVNMQEPP